MPFSITIPTRSTLLSQQETPACVRCPHKGLILIVPKEIVPVGLLIIYSGRLWQLTHRFLSATSVPINPGLWLRHLLPLAGYLLRIMPESILTLLKPGKQAGTLSLPDTKLQSWMKEVVLF